MSKSSRVTDTEYSLAMLFFLMASAQGMQVGQGGEMISPHELWRSYKDVNILTGKKLNNNNNRKKLENMVRKGCLEAVMNSGRKYWRLTEDAAEKLQHEVKRLSSGLVQLELWKGESND